MNLTGAKSRPDSSGIVLFGRKKTVKKKVNLFHPVDYFPEKPLKVAKQLLRSRVKRMGKVLLNP